MDYGEEPANSARQHSGHEAARREQADADTGSDVGSQRAGHAGSSLEHHAAAPGAAAGGSPSRRKRRLHQRQQQAPERGVHSDADDMEAAEALASLDGSASKRARPRRAAAQRVDYARLEGGMLVDDDSFGADNQKAQQHQGQLQPEQPLPLVGVVAGPAGRSGRPKYFISRHDPTKCGWDSAGDEPSSSSGGELPLGMRQHCGAGRRGMNGGSLAAGAASGGSDANGGQESGRAQALRSSGGSGSSVPCVGANPSVVAEAVMGFQVRHRLARTTSAAALGGSGSTSPGDGGGGDNAAFASPPPSTCVPRAPGSQPSSGERVYYPMPPVAEAGSEGYLLTVEEVPGLRRQLRLVEPAGSDVLVPCSQPTQPGDGSASGALPGQLGSSGSQRHDESTPCCTPQRGASAVGDAAGGLTFGTPYPLLYRSFASQGDAGNGSQVEAAAVAADALAAPASQQQQARAGAEGVSGSVAEVHGVESSAARSYTPAATQPQSQEAGSTRRRGEQLRRRLLEGGVPGLAAAAAAVAQQLAAARQQPQDAAPSTSHATDLPPPPPPIRYAPAGAAAGEAVAAGGSPSSRQQRQQGSASGQATPVRAGTRRGSPSSCEPAWTPPPAAHLEGLEHMPAQLLARCLSGGVGGMKDAAVVAAAAAADGGSCHHPSVLALLEALVQGRVDLGRLLAAAASLGVHGEENNMGGGAGQATAAER